MVVAAMLPVFGHPPVSHYALVGLAIGRSLYVSAMCHIFFFLKEMNIELF